MQKIVTGLNEAGESTVVSREAIDGVDVWEAAVTDAPEWITGHGKLMDFEPEEGWVKCMAVTFPPAGEEKPADDETATGLHKTRTIDVILVRDPMVLILEEGEFEIEAGDVVVQRGTMHDWRNPGDRPAQMLGFSYGVTNGGGTDGD